MTRPPFIRFFAILFALMFLLGQGVASAHMAEHGIDHDHHDDVPCKVFVLAEDPMVVPTPLEIETETVEEAPLIAVLPYRVIAFSSAYPSRAPPPRAPPH